MGAGQMLQALINWSHLPSNARFVLIMMASVTLDENPKPKYWGGDEPLLQALGRANPPASDTSVEAQRVRHSNDVTLRKALGQLIAAGALSYAVRPVKGRRAEYWLHLEPQGILAASARKSCGNRKKSLQPLQESLGAKEERGELRNSRGINSSQVTNSPALSTGNGHPDDHHDEASRQHAALLAWERDHQPDPTP